MDPTIEANGNRKRQKLTHNDNVLEIGSDELKAEDPRSIRLSHKPLYFKKTVEPPSSTSTKAIGLTTSWTTVHNDSTLPGPLRRTDTFQENSTLGIVSLTIHRGELLLIISSGGSYRPF